MFLDDIRRGFSQKTFLITGGTGFMGKVLLYKIMKEFPDFKNIYLLIRGKKSRKSKHFLTPQERLEKEIFTSACFDPIRESMGVEQFALLTSRVVGIEGDISNPHNNNNNNNNNNNSHNSLGISEESCKLIFNNVNFIIHMAATVNFDEKINIALHTNTLGSLRILSLAKECRRLESMVHISTCYVNYGVRGEDTMEKLYPLPFDPENMCKYILGLHEKEVDMASRELLQRYGFPNTYTFTKSMGEQLLYKYKGDCPLAIVRPSIVGCSYKEPCPGWVDALTAAGGLLLTSGLGIVHEISGRGDGIADIIPVDFVVNIIIKVLYRNYYYTKKMNSHVYNNKNDGEKKQKVGEVILNVLKNSELSNKKGLQQHVTNITSAAAAAAATTGAGEGRVAMENNNNNNNSSNNNNSNNNNNTNNNNKEVRTGGDRIIMSSAPSDSVTLCQIGNHSLPFIYHAATSSSLNKLTWRRVRDATQFYWNIKKHPRALSYMNTEFIESDIHFWLRFFFLRQVPCYILQLLARLPEPIGSERKQHLANKLGKAVFRSKDLNRQFRAFTLHEWVFDIQNTKSLDDGFCKEARATFYFDTYMINWWFYIQAYAYGMMKYIIKDTAGFEFPADPIIPTEVFRKASSL